MTDTTKRPGTATAKAWHTLAAATLLLVLTPAFPCATVRAENGAPLSIMTTIDFLDTVYVAEKVWTDEDTREQMKLLSEAGISRVYLRAANGVAKYPSDVLRKLSYCGRERCHYLHETIRLYDIVESHVRWAHEFGMEIYFWLPYSDDKVPALQYPAGSEEAERYGQYPFESDFARQYPHFQWAHRRAGELLQPVDEAQEPPTVETIKLYGTSDSPTRIAREHLALYTSDDNKIFTPYNAPWYYEDRIEDGVRTLVLSGLDIRALYIKIHVGFEDTEHTLSNRTARLMRVFDGKGDELRDFGVYVIREPDLAPAATSLEAVYQLYPTHYPLDYRNRSIGISFTHRPRPYLGGFLNYDYPEVRNHKLAVVKELLDRYALDGFYFCLRTHSRPTDEWQAYGFNQPAVEEFHRRYGINVLEEPFDRNQWAALRGESYTAFLREVRRLLGDDRKLEVCVLPGEGGPGGGLRPWYDGNVKFDWKRWAAEGLVDHLTVFIDTGWHSGLPNRWSETIAAFKQDLQDTSVDLNVYYHLAGGRGKEDDMRSVLRDMAADSHLDGVILYEEFQVRVRAGGFLHVIEEITGGSSAER